MIKTGKDVQNWKGCSKLERVIKTGKDNQNWKGESKERRGIKRGRRIKCWKGIKCRWEGGSARSWREQRDESLHTYANHIQRCWLLGLKRDEHEPILSLLLADNYPRTLCSFAATFRPPQISSVLRTANYDCIAWRWRCAASLLLFHYIGIQHSTLHFHAAGKATSLSALLISTTHILRSSLRVPRTPNLAGGLCSLLAWMDSLVFGILGSILDLKFFSILD